MDGSGRNAFYVFSEHGPVPVVNLEILMMFSRAAGLVWPIYLVKVRVKVILWRVG